MARRHGEEELLLLTPNAPGLTFSIASFITGAIFKAQRPEAHRASQGGGLPSFARATVSTCFQLLYLKTTDWVIQRKRNAFLTALQAGKCNVKVLASAGGLLLAHPSAREILLAA